MPARTELAGTEVVIRRTLPAPPELVFEVWTVPEHVTQWWGPRGYTAFSCVMEARTGGSWRVGMRSPDGRTVWARGEFREVVRPSRLVLSWAWEEPDGGLGLESTVTITLTERGGQTELLLRHAAFETIEDRDLHNQGWNDSLDRFAEHLQDQAERVES